MEVVEARLNVMQAVFLAIQTSLSLGPDILWKGQQVFQKLFNRYFTEALEVPMWGGERGRGGRGEEKEEWSVRGRMVEGKRRRSSIITVQEQPPTIIDFRLFPTPAEGAVPPAGRSDICGSRDHLREELLPEPPS